MDSLQIPLTAIAAEGLRFQETMPEAWLGEVLSQDKLFAPSGPGFLQLDVSRCAENIQVVGRADLALTSACARCGAEVPVSLKTPVEVTLVPQDKAPQADKDGALSEDDVGLCTYGHDHVDLRQIVHDEVLLDLPMQVLCQGDCLGICLRCGANHNRSSCTCAGEVEAGPFAALSQIRHQLAAEPESHS